MSVKFSNNGHSTLAASLTNSATSITVASGHGARFPSLTGSEYFYATLIDSSNNLEIVKVTARSSDVLTVTRAQESTTARAYAIGDRIELRVTAAGLVDATALDAVVADNSITAAKINVSGNGSVGQYLESDGDGSMSWSTVSAGLIQTVFASNGTSYQNGGTSYTTVVEATITPSSTSHNILIFANSMGYYHNSNGNGVDRNHFWKLERVVGGSGTDIIGAEQRSDSSMNGSFEPLAQSMYDKDNPNTTSAITYRFQMKGAGGGWDYYTNHNSTAASQLILMEVKV